MHRVQFLLTGVLVLLSCTEEAPGHEPRERGGLGAEIGISTDKFHARGPCGIKELTSYKYVVYGSGQVRK